MSEIVINVTRWDQFLTQQFFIFIGIIVAGLFSWKSYKISQFNNQVYSDEILFNARKAVRELGIKIKESQIDLSSEYKQAIEDVLNAYELSCGLYLSGALDRQRFIKLRKNEIKSLFENSDENYEILGEKSNPYTALEKVYNKIKDKE